MKFSLPEQHWNRFCHTSFFSLSVLNTYPILHPFNLSSYYLLHPHVGLFLPELKRSTTLPHGIQPAIKPVEISVDLVIFRPLLFRLNAFLHTKFFHLYKAQSFHAALMMLRIPSISI